MKYLLFALALVVFTSSGGALTLPDINAPFSMRVQIRFTQANDNPEQAAYLLRKIREIPDVTIVQREPDMLLDVNAITTKSGMIIMQIVVLKPASPVVYDLVPDRVQLRLSMQNDAAAQEAGNLIREELAKFPDTFFYKGMVGYTGSRMNVVIDGVVSSFETTYVEAARLEDQAFKEQMRNLAARRQAAKTPEERDRINAEMAKVIGIPYPKPKKQ